MNRLFLSLSLTYAWSRSWEMSNTQSANGEFVHRTGTKVKEGWHFGWHNGIADFYPYRACYDLHAKGDTERLGLAALKLRNSLRAKHKGYAQKGRGWLRTLGTRIAAPFLAMLALLVTLITFPLYLIAAIAWFVIMLFWTIVAYMAMFIARRIPSLTPRH